MKLFVLVVCNAFDLLEDQLLNRRFEIGELEKIQKYVKNQKDCFMLTEEQIESQSRFITELNAEFPELRKYRDFHQSLLEDRSYYQKWLKPDKKSLITPNSVRLVPHQAIENREFLQFLNNESESLPDSSAPKLSLALALNVANQTQKKCPEDGRSLSSGDFYNGVVDCLVTVRG